MTLRIEEPGWRVVAIPDGRRGLWYRERHEDGVLVGIDLCAGREGDDAYVELRAGQAVDIGAVEDLLSTAAYSTSLLANASNASSATGEIGAAESAAIRSVESENLEAIARCLACLAGRLRVAPASTCAPG